MLVVILLCAGLAACASPAPGSPSTGQAATVSSEPEPEATMGATPVSIVVGGQTLEARLWDSPTAQSLIDQLPLTLDFSDYGRQEVLAEPPHPLTTAGAPSGDSAPAGTIGWYAPGGVIVLYYTDVGRYDGIVRIGKIDGDVSVLAGWGGPRPVTIERAG